MQRIPDSPPKINKVAAGVERPLLSVMIPAYNCSVFLPQAIESVMAQDLGADRMQIEVVDDYSTDANVEDLVKAIGKGRVGYHRQPFNVGSLRNFETCLNRAKGEYVHLLHGDDAIEPGFYDTILGLFREYPQAGAAYTNYSYIDENSVKLPMSDNRLIEKPGIVPNFLDKIARRQLVQPPAIVVKREVYENVGSFFAAHFGEDWEMWARIASKYPIAYNPDRFACYRVANVNGISHSSFLTGQNIVDITRIINIIEGYLPANKRKEIKDFALAYYAIYCVKVANGLLETNPKAAFIQVKGAFKMKKNLNTFYWVVRFYLMHFLRYKQLQNFVERIKAKYFS